LVQIDEPVRAISTDLEAHIEGQNVTITHMGGRTLESYHVKIYVGVGSSINRSFLIPDGFPGTKRTWSIGEQWETDISGEITDANNWNMRLFVQVVDSKAGRILLDQILIGGLEDKSFPDVGFEIGSLDFTDSNPDSGDIIDINVTVVNYGMVES